MGSKHQDHMRLFIQVNPALLDANIVHWVEILITEEFVTQVRHLHYLVEKHQLLSVEAEVDANWHLHNDWRVCNANGPRSSQISVWESGFTIKTYAERVGESEGPKTVSSPVNVAYISGSAEDFFTEFHPDLVDEPFDRLETAEGLFEHEPGTPDWSIEFARQLDIHLRAIDQRPLKVWPWLESQVPPLNANSVRVTREVGSK